MGKILWEGLEIKGANTAGLVSAQWRQLGAAVWQDQTNHIAYSLKTQADGSTTLLIGRKGDELRVDHWVSGNLGIALSAGSSAPAATLIYNGDQRARLIGIEIDLTVPATDTRFNTYKWPATSWAANGTLTGGVVQANFNDVIEGSSGIDSINGLGGNDALDGGAGSDIIFGGAGNDMIVSAAGLNVPQRAGPDDAWHAPSGKIVWIAGNT